MSERHIVAFKALLGKDKVYVDADKVCAIVYAEANTASALTNGATIKIAVTQIIFTGGHVLTTEKLKEVRDKLGWRTVELDVDEKAA